jgi:hypothetical protein
VKSIDKKRAVPVVTSSVSTSISPSKSKGSRVGKNEAPLNVAGSASLDPQTITPRPGRRLAFRFVFPRARSHKRSRRALSFRPPAQNGA